MLFVVVEYFKAGSPEAVRERFRLKGRMLPEGVNYHASWVTTDGARCFQVMESPNLELLQVWMNRWEDLVEFEVDPVLASSDFWADYETSHRP
jgi:hypothetical protein